MSPDRACELLELDGNEGGGRGGGDKSALIDHRLSPMVKKHTRHVSFSKNGKKFNFILLHTYATMQLGQ